MFDVVILVARRRDCGLALVKDAIVLAGLRLTRSVIVCLKRGSTAREMRMQQDSSCESGARDHSQARQHAYRRGANIHGSRVSKVQNTDA